MDPPEALRVLIVDGRVSSRTALHSMLKDDSSVESLEAHASSADGLAAMEGSCPDLVLVRADPPNAGALELLKGLEGCDPVSILVTEDARTATRAFEIGAADCLVEPFGRARFELALERAKAELTRRRALRLLQRLRRVLEEGVGAGGTAEGRHVAVPAAAAANGRPADPQDGDSGSAEKFVVSRAGRTVIVRPRDVEWIEAAGCYARIHCGEDAYLHRITMKELEASLSPHRFFRIHRSHLVRLDQVREVRTRDSGGHGAFAILQDGTRLPIAQRRRAALLEALSRSD